MSERAGQIEGPAKWAAVAVLGGVGLLGVGRSFFVDTVHAPPAQAVPQLVRTEPMPRVAPAAPAAPLASAAPVAAVAAAASTDEDAPVAGEPIASTAASAPASPPALSASDDVAVRIAVNTASAAELDLLPGIGPVYAQRIVDDRTANGPFTSLQDLQRVRGIGPKTAEKLAPLITFDRP